MYYLVTKLRLWETVEFGPAGGVRLPFPVTFVKPEKEIG